MTTASVTHQQVIELVKMLPQERLQSLYDFTVFLKQQSTSLTPETDLFGESGEEIEDDEARTGKNSLRLRVRACARWRGETKEDYLAGRTKPMEFDANGRLVR